MSLPNNKRAEMVKRIDAAMKIVRPSSLSCRFSELDDLRRSAFDALDKRAGALSRLKVIYDEWRRKRAVEAEAARKQLSEDRAVTEQALAAVTEKKQQEAEQPAELSRLDMARLPKLSELPKLAEAALAAKKRPTRVRRLLKAKQHSDHGDYDSKHRIMRGLIAANPAEFVIDSEKGGMLGITHVPTNFRIHLPMTTVQDMRLEHTKIATTALIPLEVRGKQASIQVEIAEGPWAEARGLGGRTDLPDDQGMLFKRADGFWMRGVNFDLDILFLDKAGTVLDVQTMTKLADGEFPAIYTPAVKGASLALEVSAGWAVRKSVTVGDQIVAGNSDLHQR